ncbi:hypothetical protein GCM10027187_08770 [Streptosporangium sandarakinum]
MRRLTLRLRAVRGPAGLPRVAGLRGLLVSVHDEGSLSGDASGWTLGRHE